MLKKFLIVLIVFALIFSNVALAKGNGNGKGHDSKSKDDIGIESLLDSEDITEESTDMTEEISAEEDVTEALTTKQIKQQTKEAKKAYIEMRKELQKSNYTGEELEALKATTEALKENYLNLKVLSFNSIFSNKTNFKFDTPPVIKYGRTLIPVRAITEGYGAKLEYNNETQQVTITKDTVVIVLTLGEKTATVNGTEVELDVESSVINNRTYVPLRFIVENFKLNLVWDEDSETIEIIDPEEESSEPSTEAASDSSNEAVTDPSTETSSEDTTEATTEVPTEASSEAVTQ